ncbi:MAG TPA: DedA family protein [Candidatus Dormibacteraeota bacterium]
MHSLLQVADRLGYPAAALGILIESVGIPFPGETALLIVAAYAAAGHLAIGLVILFGFAGATLGGDIGYAIGYFGGRPLVERVFRLLRVSPRRLAQTEEFFARHGAKAMFVARFVIGARSYGSMLAGMARMPLLHFQIYSTAGSALWAVVIGLLGYFLGHNLPLLEKVIRDVGIAGAVLIGAALLVTYLVARRRGVRI